MDSFRENLGALADCEASLADLSRELSNLPEQIAKAEARAQESRDILAAEREGLAAAEKSRRDKEAEAADCEAQREKFQGQTALVKTNHEYTALLHEIDGMTQRISKVEDEILLAMEAAEASVERLETDGRDQKAAEKKALDEAGDMRKRMSFVEGEIAEQTQLRDGLLEHLGPKVKASYSRVASVRGTGVGQIVAGNCAACHRAVPPEVENRVLAGELHCCANCLRILVKKDE